MADTSIPPITVTAPSFKSQDGIANKQGLTGKGFQEPDLPLERQVDVPGNQRAPENFYTPPSQNGIAPYAKPSELPSANVPHPNDKQDRNNPKDTNPRVDPDHPTLTPGRSGSDGAYGVAGGNTNQNQNNNAVTVNNNITIQNQGNRASKSRIDSCMV